MIAALLILGVLSLLIGISVWLLFRADQAISLPSPQWVATATRYKVPEVPVAPEPTVTVRFLNERGRTIGQLEIPAARRKPTLVLEKLGTRHICQASHQDPDGTWIYRRSGRE